MINEFTFPNLLLTAIPCGGLILSGMLAAGRDIGESLLSKFQHIAAGVVISAVSLELLPSMLNANSWPGMTLGYCLGVATMLGVDRYGEQLGNRIPIGIDLFVDGLLLSIGFAAGEKGGLLLLAGLTLETISLGLVIGPPIRAQGKSRFQVLTILAVLGMALMAGAACGSLIPLETGFWFAGLLGFGVAALLFLVVEELISEAHKTEDTTLTTTLFFIGFLIPLLLGQISSIP